MKLILDSSFYKAYEILSHNLPQAILLTGGYGVGLATIAMDIAKQASDTIIVAPRLLTKTSTVAQIGIERIRELYEESRTHGDRIIVLDDADMMTISAQHAFLKLLEEPNAATRFILTSHAPEQLLPTIISRITRYHVPYVSSKSTDSMMANSTPAKKRQQLTFIASGKPAEMKRLLDDESYFANNVKQMTLAKQLIMGSSYDRAVAIQKSTLSRTESLALLTKCIELLDREATPDAFERTHHCVEAYSRIARGGSVKLQLIRAMV